ncbi:RNA pyrophosphohydrolase [Candidatus Endolissoclinum faulkneri L2]|uniref:RNA pyrophosphohydrolase n=1 Tax=Candidatus Endolissoclinum faulkneri L2 TaxID=1193729 RepID=K7Z4C9_9PROT|nr:RNA pyrophosphohydrolase [Candidatus Endolissoclinum faulkneri]AFX98868.1 RNA pyrophosphohydrolase [Candidatus Endolissoclinum faulkneri L2]
MIEHTDFRLSIGIVLFNDQKKIFLGKRIDIDNAWQMPQGGIDKGETPYQAGLRELEEEIGTKQVEIVAETRDWIAYEFPTNLAGTVHKKWRGQIQKWLACKFTGTTIDINLQTEYPEFDDWQWVDINCVTELIVPFKRAAYRRVMSELTPVIYCTSFKEE